MLEPRCPSGELISQANSASSWSGRYSMPFMIEMHAITHFS